MKYTRYVPCDKCPFRRGASYLTAARAREIATTNGEFPCHETVDYDAGDGSGVTRANSQVCAGFVAFNLKSGCPSQMIRIAGRLGMFDADKFKDAEADVFDSVAAMVRSHRARREKIDRPAGYVEKVREEA